jgi:hypothetical protein
MHFDFKGAAKGLAGVLGIGAILLFVLDKTAEAVLVLLVAVAVFVLGRVL